MSTMIRLKTFLALLLLFQGLAGAALIAPDFTAIVERTAPAVVNIEAIRTAGREPQGFGPSGEMEELFRRFFGEPGLPQMPIPRDQVSSGSGFIITPDGFVLTNHHVVDGADRVVVKMADRREFDARIVGTDPASDVALLKIEASDLPTLKLGDSSKLKPGEWVIAIGSPFGFEHSVTAGVVSGTGRSVGSGQQYVPFIQTDVPINRGNSGGPLINMAGEAVGINSQIFSNTGGFMGLSFAVPIEVARNVADQIREKGRVIRGRLGVNIQEVTREFAKTLGLERPRGALVSGIVPGSAAEKAGIRVQDVILSFNGREILRSSELPPLVGATPPGTRAEVEVFRDGRVRKLTVVVDELPAEGALAASGSRSGGGAAAGRLGIVVEALTAEQRERLGLKQDEGVLIAGVSGAAARAGLRPGDIVLMVGRDKVGSPAEFERRTRGVKPGDTVMLLVRRGDQTVFFAVTPREQD
ncbi:MAG: peptidase S1 [Lysobacterales bacterium]|jgi:serine protease Do|nr:MAG: peptidase S1 [Xanthomonadales bacterium]